MAVPPQNDTGGVFILARERRERSWRVVEMQSERERTKKRRNYTRECFKRIKNMTAGVSVVSEEYFTRLKLIYRNRKP